MHPRTAPTPTSLVQTPNPNPAPHPQGFIGAGYAVTRFQRGPSGNLGSPMNKFFVDVTPTVDDNTLSANLYKLANIRGPLGGRVSVHFKEEVFTKLLMNNCKICFRYKDQCIGSKCLGGRSSSGAGSSADRGTKRDRDYAALERAFGM
jgi:hypothetical protein